MSTNNGPLAPREGLESMELVDAARDALALLEQVARGNIADSTKRALRAAIAKAEGREQ